jgi:tight adherence protein B
MTSTQWLLFGSVFCAVFCAVMTLLEILYIRKKQNVMQKVIEPLYREDALQKRGPVGRFVQWFNRSEYGREHEEQLRSADLKLSPFQWILIYLAAWLLISFLLSKLFSLPFPYNVLVGYFVWKMSANQLLKVRRNKLASAINKQLPEVCRLLASSIKAGLSIQQGIELVASELKPPAGRLFQVIASELKMGAAMDTVLTQINERVNSKDLKLMNSSILIQRRTGGNLAQVLEHLARTLEERERLNQEIQNSSAESRFIAIILTIMPVFIVMMFNSMFDGFVMLIFTLPGMIITAVSALLITVGLVVIRKISNIKV